MKRELVLCINSLSKAKSFVVKTNEFESDIDIIRGRYVIDAKSIMGILSISLLEPMRVVIRTDNKEEIMRFNEMMEEFK